MFRKLIVKFLSRRAAKFIAAGLGGAVTWVASHGVPLDAWVSDAWIEGTGAAVTAALVYLVRNVGDGGEFGQGRAVGLTSNRSQ